MNTFRFHISSPIWLKSPYSYGICSRDKPGVIGMRVRLYSRCVWCISFTWSSFVSSTDSAFHPILTGYHLLLSFCSGAWPHAAYHRCYEPKSAEDEANIRALCLAWNQVCLLPFLFYGHVYRVESHLWLSSHGFQVAVECGSRRLGPSVGRGAKCRSRESVCVHHAQHRRLHRAHVHFERISDKYSERLAAVRAHGSRYRTRSCSYSCCSSCCCCCCSIIGESLSHPTVISTGTFTLDLERLPLAGLLQERFGWASLLAVQKAITFRVEDDTLATEFGPGSAVDDSVESAGRNCDSIPTVQSSPMQSNLTNCGIVDVENGRGVVEEALLAQKTVCLQVDMCRIDQVMRNLITNAVSTRAYVCGSDNCWPIMMRYSRCIIRRWSLLPATERFLLGFRARCSIPPIPTVP